MEKTATLCNDHPRDIGGDSHDAFAVIDWATRLRQIGYIEDGIDEVERV
jgi:hypothetical protein